MFGEIFPTSLGKKTRYVSSLTETRAIDPGHCNIAALTRRALANKEITALVK